MVGNVSNECPNSVKKRNVHETNVGERQLRATHSHGNCKIVRSAERKGKKACTGRAF